MDDAMCEEDEDDDDLEETNGDKGGHGAPPGLPPPAHTITQMVALPRERDQFSLQHLPSCADCQRLREATISMFTSGRTQPRQFGKFIDILDKRDLELNDLNEIPPEFDMMVEKMHTAILQISKGHRQQNR